MPKFVDNLLNRVTMYRLTLYYLLGLLIFACLFGYFGLIPYSPLALVISVTYIGLISWIANITFAKIFKAPANVESIYITALILAFIITPIKSFSDTTFYTLAAWASVIAMASKYIIAIRKKHIFNPAAVAVVITSLFLGLSASWWVGTPWMIAPTVIGGILLTRKISRTNLILSFFALSIITLFITHGFAISSSFLALEKLLFTSGTFFFALVMLTEPMTTPPTKWLRIFYGSIVGFLFVPSVHFGSIYLTPELALVIGNIFAYIVSPKEKLILRLKEKREIADNTFDFVFASNRAINFKPGQYMEWTLPENHSDNRGNRRYFTIASSPTEEDLRVGIRAYEGTSTFKRDMLALKSGKKIVASQRAGDFVLPRDKSKKLVFIAGGIGITPFRSMTKFILDKKERRDIVLIYQNKSPADVAYREIFEDARRRAGIKYLETFKPLTREKILAEIPDFALRTFYISGPDAMVSSYKNLLMSLNVPRSQIKIDYFPGF